MPTCYGRHDHRGQHRYRSRLCARQHGRDHRVSVGRVRDRMVHKSAAPAPPRTARRTVTYEASYPALAKGAHHPTAGRAGSDEKLDGLGFDEQIFGADKQVPGRGQSDKRSVRPYMMQSPQCHDSLDMRQPCQWLPDYWPVPQQCRCSIVCRRL